MAIVPMAFGGDGDDRLYLGSGNDTLEGVMVTILPFCLVSMPCNETMMNMLTTVMARIP